MCIRDRCRRFYPVGVTDGLQTLRITLTGDDRPGVTSALLQAVAPLSADVLDLEQIVVRDHLTLTLLLRTAGTADARRELRSAVQAVADRLGMQAKVSEGVGDSHERPAGRAHVVVLGRPLGAGALGAVTARIAAHGANICLLYTSRCV